jgi:poly(3-hydroxybutyrate) depolymerase
MAIVLGGCMVQQSLSPAPAPAATPAAVATGGIAGQTTADIGGTSFIIFTYQPAGCQPTAVLVVFHGVGRNAAGYRDDVIPLAQRYCVAVAAPLFDDARFPSWSYQRGGIEHERRLVPEDQRTVRYARLVADWARKMQGRPDLPYLFVGHSAGGQFLSRVAAYTDDGARVTIIANPSTWVRPRTDVPAPYGFGGLPDGEAALRRYLSTRVAVLLGGDDHGTKELADSKEAEEQGADRFQRGQTVFAEAQQAAKARGMKLNWTLDVVPGVGHDAGRMLQSDAAFIAAKP